MPIKSSAHIIKGMTQDPSPSKANPQYAVDAQNIRITARENTSLLSIVNEKGNSKVPLKNKEGSEVSITGTYIGSAVLNQYFVLFIHVSGTVDSIYRLEKMKDSNNKEYFELVLLFTGNLNLSSSSPIETLAIYENESIQKVYWTDGVNQPRVINIVASESIRNAWKTDSFDFIRTLSLKEEVTITKNTVAGGSFAPGVIQYVFSYFNTYGQQSNIFYTSPLYYTSYNTRGASPEDKVSNSFSINISNVDTKFDYIRVYSIHRTSINATPDVKKITDLPICNNTSISYTDTGLNGDSIDPTELLYIGGEELKIGTFAQKDNTLFMGDIELIKSNVSNDIKEHMQDCTITFSANKEIESPEQVGYYPYYNQLKYNSNQIKTFKYLEYYRFGVQLQNSTGKWSDPIWINDVQNTIPIQSTFYSDEETDLIIASTQISNTDSFITQMHNAGYVKIRPVIVYPTINDRSSVCQGILCPTVYNVGDRDSNSPFAQSSWFIRPNAPYDITTSSGETSTPNVQDEYSRGAVLSNSTIEKGTWQEFRHNHPIPSNTEYNAEIQCIYDPPTNPYIDNGQSSTTWVSNNLENFYIDQSILTFHSPDIEFDSDMKSIDSSSLNLRIVGIVPLTSFISDIDIQTSTPVLNYIDSSNTSSTDVPQGFYKERVGVENNFDNAAFGSYFGWRGASAFPYWYDEVAGRITSNIYHAPTSFIVYPWHRNGSLNNTEYATDGYRSAMLSKKNLYNLKLSYKTQYLSSTSIWTPTAGISGVSIFDSDEVSLVRLPAPKNSGLQDINYYGNIDKLLSITRNTVNKKDGYPITTLYVGGNSSAAVSTTGYTKLTTGNTPLINGIDPVRIKYKSTPHAVLALNYSNTNAQIVLPTIQDYNTATPSITQNINDANDNISGKFPFWNKNTTVKVSQDILEHIKEDIPRINEQIGGIQFGWLWLGELYRDSVPNRFGGKTDEAFENNTWVQCGESVSLIDASNNPLANVQVIWKEGDTYYQRYDCLKTYPFTLEDQNSVTEVVSFMCETRVNIDGRYDRNRGQTSNTSITPSNFNLINSVYSQPNNFFNYRILNQHGLDLNNFHNSITWTKTKTAGELVDTWTNVTLASTLDLDGDKGRVRALKRFNNNIIAFQDRGISQILYNENMQIASSEGVPIEIANSGKVNGKRYIANNVGCSNKWSMTESQNGLYFIDKETNSIYLFNGQLTSLTDKYGFRKWLGEQVPYSDNFRSFCDKNNSDIYFNVNNGDSTSQCLCYSEFLGQFTSFMDYKDVNIMFNMDSDFYAWKDGALWHNFAGDYNMFFGTFKPFSITIVENADESLDKIFDNIDFRADSWDGNTLTNVTFDTLKVWNEYQSGTASLLNIKNKPSALKRKFRVWRAIIPRDDSNHRDRIRNTWAYIKLAWNNSNTYRTELHDLNIQYFI